MESPLELYQAVQRVNFGPRSQSVDHFSALDKALSCNSEDKTAQATLLQDRL